MTDFPTDLERLILRYDAFVFDLWGVMHDGATAYPSALAAMQRLHAHNKRIGVISNSPRLAAAAQENIAQKFGILPDYYDVLLTSGQVAYEALRERSDPWLQKIGTRCIMIGPEHEVIPYLSLGLHWVDTPEEAEFVFCSGLQPGLKKIADYQPMLEAWHKANLPLLCVNPDRHVMQGKELMLAGGGIGAAYKAMGGDVYEQTGKPYPAIFQKMSAALGVAPEQTLMIGDNLQTDIAGAVAAGMGTLWVVQGVHGPELAMKGWSSQGQLRDYVKLQGLDVQYIMPRLQ